MQNDLPATP